MLLEHIYVWKRADAGSDLKQIGIKAFVAAKFALH
jgi:hypothetical protein